MGPEQWNQVVELFHAAREKTGEERKALLESACAGNSSLRQSVEQMLRDDEASDSFLDDSPSHLLATMPVSVTPSLRAKFGRYEVVAPLGRGGMGEVWEARDTELDRRVALKFLAGATALGRAGERLTREARAASALNHPNIVTVHEIFHDQETPVLVMELVEGTTLRAVAKTPQSIGRVVNLGGQIAQALAAAHAHGIVHRDVKPENFIVRDDGYVKVLDFGLARHVSSESAASSGGLLAGTLRYMSPEQARGESLSPASDIFSFGLVLYELVAGRHAFPADSPFEAVRAIQASEVAPPSSLNPLVPVGLDSLILAMLAKDPQARPSAAEVDGRLSEIGLSPSPTTAWSPLSRTRERAEPATSETSRRPARNAGLRYLAAGLIACLAWVFALWLLWGKLFPSREPVMTQLTTQESENRVTAAAISPDGKNLAFAALGDSIYLRRMSDGFTRPISTPPGLTVDRIAWFADRTRLLVSGSSRNQLNGVWVIPIGAGTPKMVIPDAKDAVSSPDGTRIAFANLDGSAIWVAGVRGDEAREVQAGGNTTSFSSLIWSPDSKRIGYERQDYAPQMDLQVDGTLSQLQKNYAYTYESVDVATGRVIASAKNVVITSACGLPDGRVLFLRWISPALTLVDQLWELRTDPHTGKLRGPPRQLTHARDLVLSSISSSNDGKQVAAVVTIYRSNVYVADLPPPDRVPALLNTRRLTFAEADEFPHAWTPDNRTIIFESNRNGNYDLYRQNTDHGEAKQLVVSPGDNVLPQVSPDGKWVLYRSMQGISSWTLMRIPVEGGKAEPVPTAGKRGEFRCPLEAGTPCVLRTVANGQFVFNELDPVRGQGRELARTAWSPTIRGDWDVSPGGSEVAIPNHSPDDAKIRVVALRARVPGRAEKTVTLSGLEDLNGVVWAAGGRGWYVSIRTSFGGRLFYVDLQDHSTELLDSANPIYTVPSPDGRHVAFPEARAWSNAWLFHGF